MRSRRSRTQRSISLEMLIGIVVGLMVLSFLAGWFLGGRHAVKKMGASEAAAVTVAAAETPADDVVRAAKAAETTAAETVKAAETTAVPETAKAAETTAAPETTKAPETTAAPTTAAETTAAPETTKAPETTAAPTTAAETTAAPETTAARKTTGDEDPGEAPTYLDTVIKKSSLNGVASGTVLSASEVDTAHPENYNMILSIAEGDYTYTRMEGRSLKESSAVDLDDLRYVKVLHYNDDGKIQVGELVVHKDILDDVTAVFAELFEKKYPISSMNLIDNYFGGGTAASAEARSAERNNTTCFCGGAKTSSGETAPEAYGKAILLNPGSGSSEDEAAAVFRAHGFTKNGKRYEKLN